MIKAEKGNITINESSVQLLAEFSCIAIALRDALAPDFGEAYAEVLVKHAFNLAFPSPTFTPGRPDPAEKPKPDKLDLTKEQKDALLDLVREIFEEDEK